MTETRKTTRFALLFFLYFMGTSVAVAMVPAVRNMSDSAYMLLAQLLSFLPPIIFYFLYTKKDVRKTLRLNPLGWKNVLLIISFGVSIQPVMSLLSYVMSLFFPNPVEQSVTGIHASGLILSMLSVAVIPAFLEEVFSRGILLSGYRFLGKWKAAFFSALLFGLLHMNPQQLPYAFVVGFLFCFLVERTDSLYASILPHMVINGTTVISIFTEGAGMGPVEMETSVILLTLLLMALFSLPWLAFLFYLFLKINPPKNDFELMDENGKVYTEKILTPSMVLIILLYIGCGIIPYLNP
ncbi:MAG: CPBP family intramembrane metalloprotease [Anaerotignum sp.]|nr:CPBP family intramembrane metalloprotease [Anaerotignum sp.]